MARIATPRYEIRSIRYNENNRPYVSTINRAYARIDKKFEPIGWFVVWIDGLEQVILDADVPSPETAYENYTSFLE